MQPIQLFEIPVPVNEISLEQAYDLMSNYISFFTFEIIKIEVVNKILIVAVIYT
jgi:hypothetical protein